jgi:ribosomal protein L21E
MARNYSVGTKVRISVGGNAHHGWYSHLRSYEGMTGEVLSSVETVAYVLRPWGGDADAPAQVMRAYRVHLDSGPEIEFVSGDYLEVVEV